jgi:hypothetical protein
MISSVRDQIPYHTTLCKQYYSSVRFKPFVLVTMQEEQKKSRVHRINVERNEIGICTAINLFCTLKLQLYWNTTVCTVHYLFQLPKAFSL